MSGCHRLGSAPGPVSAGLSLDMDRCDGQVGESPDLPAPRLSGRIRHRLVGKHKPAPDGLDPIYLLIGPGVRKVALHGWDGSSGYDPTGIPASRIHLEYEPRGNNPPIQGVLTLGGFKRETEWHKVYYRNHSVFEGVANTNWGKCERTLRDIVLDIQEVFVTNKSPETRDDILNKLKVLIGAYKSANEGNRPVMLSEVDDYRMPTVRIEKWDVIP